MNCNCIELVKDKIIEVQPLKDKKIIDAKLPTSLNLIGKKLHTVLTIEAKCTVHNRKAPIKLLMNYSYCPFCGKACVGDFEEPIAQDDLVNELNGVPDIAPHALLSWIKAKGLKIYKEVKDGI
jgi:hypothetical protein